MNMRMVALAIILSPLVAGCGLVPGAGLAKAALKLAVGPERAAELDPRDRLRRQFLGTTPSAPKGSAVSRRVPPDSTPPASDPLLVVR